MRNAKLRTLCSLLCSFCFLCALFRTRGGRGAAAAASTNVEPEETTESLAAVAPPTPRGRKASAAAAAAAAASSAHAAATAAPASSAAAAAASSTPASAAAAAAASPVVVHHPKIAITGIDVTTVLGAGFEKALSKLGGVLVDDVLSCTHLLTDKVRRTEKFLTAYSTCPVSHAASPPHTTFVAHGERRADGVFLSFFCFLSAVHSHVRVAERFDRAW